jgi:RNA polymerase sigma factor (sigma-70 family)
MSILDPEAVTRLWDEHSAALVLYARQWCDRPEDVVQDAFLMLVRQVVSPDRPVGWLYRVVRNRAINAARSRGRQTRHETAAAVRGEPWFEASEGAELDAATATKAMEHLPIECREVIVARLWGGVSFDEIARLRGESLSKVYRSYQRGLSALRERLVKPCLTTKTKMKN